MAAKHQSFARALILTLSVLASACTTERGSLFAEYQAPFDPEKIQLIEPVIQSVANRHGMTVLELDETEMSILTNGRPAFYRALYRDDKSIVAITNVGAGTTLIIQVSKYGSVSDETLSQVSDDLRASLTEALGVEFHQTNSDAPILPSGAN